MNIVVYDKFTSGKHTGGKLNILMLKVEIISVGENSTELCGSETGLWMPMEGLAAVTRALNAAFTLHHDKI